jgi:D-alanine-D-alanine ligase-like ATP-grasp enzyme
LEDTVEKGGKRIEVNTVEAINNSKDKLRMKNCFQAGEVKTALWIAGTTPDAVIAWANTENIGYPIVAKHRFGSRGRGNTLVKTAEALKAWLVGKNLNSYIFEKFYNYNREYRLHVTEEGCFYTCRKMLKEDTPEDKRWFRNDSNCTWFMEANPGFDRPTNWDNIVTECVKSLKAVGLDFGACDLRVQSAKTEKGKVREVPDFIIVEINSAPSFGDVTLERYLEQLPIIINRKINKK